VQNPGLVLKPDMFVNVEIMTSSHARLVIPRSAVLDSGTRQIVTWKKAGCLRDASGEARVRRDRG
jgi:hypothetical protein